MAAPDSVSSQKHPRPTHCSLVPQEHLYVKAASPAHLSLVQQKQQLWYEALPRHAIPPMERLWSSLLFIQNNSQQPWLGQTAPRANPAQQKGRCSFSPDSSKEGFGAWEQVSGIGIPDSLPGVLILARIVSARLAVRSHELQAWISASRCIICQPILCAKLVRGWANIMGTALLEWMWAKLFLLHCLLCVFQASSRKYDGLYPGAGIAPQHGQGWKLAQWWLCWEKKC